MAARPKPPIAAWIQRERKRLKLKPAELLARLQAAGADVSTDQTIRVWESNADRSPRRDNIEALERIFGSQAPLERPETPDALVAAIKAQAEAIQALALEIRLSRAEELLTRQEMMKALGLLAEGRDLLGKRDAAEHGTPVGAR